MLLKVTTCWASIMFIYKDKYLLNVRESTFFTEQDRKQVPRAPVKKKTGKQSKE